jgi:hypothetical protein
MTSSAKARRQAADLLRSATVLGLASAAILSGCVHYRYRVDIPRQVMQAPDAQVWGVGLLKARSGFRVVSVTSLNGRTEVRGKPTVEIESGAADNWEWSVRAVPPLLASWNAWQSDMKVQRRAGTPEDWSHPVASWQQAFDRSHKVVSYLLGRQPLPLRASVLLVPDGSAYHKTFTETGEKFVPLTFAFYYPASVSTAAEVMSQRFSALTTAVSTTVYEYQHIFVDTKSIQQVGDNEADETINDEARSQCWFDSVLLALTSGTHSSESWHPSEARERLLEKGGGHEISLEPGEQASSAAKPSDKTQRRYVEALPWARYFEARSISDYLRKRGIADPKVASNDPAAMNAVLSVCRAMTQHPLDVTATNGYPPSWVEYVPFFPTQLKR